MPKRWEEETMPAFVMDHDVPVPPSIASDPLAVVFTLPVLVIANGLLVVVNVSGPVTALLIVWPPPAANSPAIVWVAAETLPAASVASSKSVCAPLARPESVSEFPLACVHVEAPSSLYP